MRRYAIMHTLEMLGLKFDEAHVEIGHDGLFVTHANDSIDEQSQLDALSQQDDCDRIIIMLPDMISDDVKDDDLIVDHAFESDASDITASQCDDGHNDQITMAVSTHELSLIGTVDDHVDANVITKNDVIINDDSITQHAIDTVVAKKQHSFRKHAKPPRQRR